MTTNEDIVRRLKFVEHEIGDIFDLRPSTAALVGDIIYATVLAIKHEKEQKDECL